MSTTELRPPVVADDPLPRPRRRRLLLLAGLGALLVLVVWVVAFSPVLGVRTVQVRGNGTLTPAQVRAAAAISSGTPLLRLDPGAIARRVEQLPEVAHASVRTSLPSTVVITVDERVAVGYLAAPLGFRLVDATGDAYRAVPAKPARLPLFALPAGAPGRATGQAVATVAAALPAAVRAQVASIQGFDPGAITVLLADGRVVQWGSAERSADKARILTALLTQPGTRFDLSNPDLVVAH